LKNYPFSATHQDLYRPASTELHRHALETPWWIYVVSLVIGLLILLLITGLFKKVGLELDIDRPVINLFDFQMGFFKRDQKEEMDTYFSSVSYFALENSTKFSSYPFDLCYRTWKKWNLWP
jgi:hypothetical protein